MGGLKPDPRMRRFTETQDTQTQSNILVYRDSSFQKTAADALEKLTVEKEGNGGGGGPNRLQQGHFKEKESWLEGRMAKPQAWLIGLSEAEAR